jgi:predicted lipoprotein with Yx(FWY)xxD motif
MMQKVRLTIATSIVALFATTAAFAQMSSTPANVKVSDGVLTDSKGMTLYIYDKDTTPGKSDCNGQCVANWPALPVASGAMAMGDWSIVARDDGTKQWAYKGKPLYTFAHDAKPGEVTGDGKGNVWHTAKP